MNAKTKSHRFPAILLSLACAGLAGCTATSYRQGDAAALSMERAAAEVQTEARCLDLTLASLKTLETEPGADLKRPFQHFNYELDRLIAAERRTEATGKRMQLKNAAYLKEWDKRLAAIEFGHVHDLSQTRRTEVASRFETVNRRYLDSQAVVVPMIAYLQDIRKALSADLTAEGLTSMKSIAQNADQNATKVRTALLALSGELSESGSRMATMVAGNNEAASPVGRGRQASGPGIQ